ncbi:MAG: hypothetical protein HYV02_00515 [Deltaproteobacteria bacterium]|nr:hypothetical protein [Deltaproteobacteria bacterium]
MWRRLAGCLLIALLGVACKPSVSGQVYFAGNAATAEGEPLGILGIPIELYLVKSYVADKNSGGNGTSKAATFGGAMKGAQVEEGEGAPPTDEDPSADDAEEKEAPAGDAPPDDSLAPGSTETDGGPQSPSATGTLVTTLKTDSAGRYYFGDLDPGEYEVRLGDETWQQGYRLMTEKNPIAVKTAFRGARAYFGLYRQGMELVTSASNCPAIITFPQSVYCEQTYRNTGPAPMVNVQLTVSVPETIEMIPKFGGTVDQAARLVTWSYPSIAPQEMVKVGAVLVPHLPASEVVIVELHWQVASASDPTPVALGGISTSINSVAKAMVSVEGAAKAVPGIIETYKVYVDNTGTQLLTDVVLHVTVPEGITYQLSDGGQYDATSRQVTWTLKTLMLDAHLVHAIAVQIPEDAKVGSSLLWKAEVVSPKLSEPVMAKPFTTVIIAPKD